MLYKFLKFNTKKIISILCAIAVLATALPLSALLMPTKAATTGDYIDFEGKDAANIVDGNDNFSLLGVDKEDKYYFYAKNNTDKTLSITFDGIELEANKNYTLNLDVYTLRTSKDDDNSLLGLKVYGENEVSLEKSVSNLDICEEAWANYHTTFTAKENSNKLDFSLFTFGKVFIDNFAIIDENGKEIALDFAKACENTEHPDHFSSATLYDIAYDEIDVIDGYLKAAVPENSNTIHNEGVDIPFNLPEKIEEGRYTLKVDLKFTALGTCRDSFCASIAGSGAQIQQKWINAVDIELNKYATYTFEFDLLPAHNYFRFNVYQGCTAYIDNVILIDATGSEIININFDEPVNFSGNYYEQKGIPKTKAQSKALYQRLMTLSSEDNYVVAIDNSKGTNFGQLYLHEVGMPYDTTYPAGDYTIKFDFYALEIGSSKNIVAQLTKPDWSGDAFPGNGQKWLEVQEKLNEWQTLSFDITTVAEGRFPWFYIGAGMKGYFDNYQIIDKKTGNTVLNFTPTAADLGKTSKDICKVEKIAGKTDDEPVVDNYVVAIDNSKGTNFGQLYLHEVGMDYSKTYPVGDYTFKFDFYALEIGSNKNIVAHLTAPNWSGDAYPYGSGQKWLEIEEKLNEWQTISFDVTTVKDGQFPWFYIGAGIKGYFDNYQIIDKKTGETVLNFTPTATDLGKTSKDICKVEKIAGKTDDEPAVKETVLLVDTTSVTDNGSDNKSFWFNELGMPSYYNKLVSGKTYTVIFDVYPIEVPTANNTFHFRTANGQPNGSSHAGFWGKNADFEVGKWQTTSNTFKIDNAAASGNHILYVYGGFKGYIDNFRIVDENGDTVEGTFTGFDDLTVPDKHKDYLTITEITIGGDEPEAPEHSNDFAVLVDNSKGSDFAQLYLHEVGMDYSKTYPVGDYTIKFDFYALEIASNKNIVAHLTAANWNGDAFPYSSGQKWLEIENKLNEWQTISFDVTTVKEGQFPWFYIGAGIKGYFDNYQIIDKKTGNTVLDFTPIADDLGKTSKVINTVVELPVDVADRDGGSTPEQPEEPEKTSGMKITVLRGMAGKDGATIKLGGANSPLTIKSNSTYRLSFRYYQANPTNTGTLNLFGINAGFDNDIAYFKKNNTTGWANGTLYFTTGEVSDASADWLEIILNPNAWVYFDDFKIVEQAVDNNKEVSVITFDNADDSIYPSATVEKAEFGQSTEKGGTFKVVNATEYTNDTKNSNRQYTFKGIKMNSNTTYKVSLDYYVAAPFNDYAAAFGYDQTGLGTGSGNSWPCFIDNEASTGWHTVSFTVTTGDVVPNGNYINLAFYDVADSSEPRVMHFDNLTLTKLYKIETSTNDGSLGSMTKTFSTEAGKDAKVVANAYAGAKFEGWYEYGDLVSTDKIYRIKNVNDNHKLVAKFSGEVKPDKTIVQSFEDYDIGDIGMEYYEIVNDSKNVLDGKQSLHVKPDKIGNNIEASIFFPVVANAEQQMKDDYIYDVYVWVKPTKEAESVAYYALLTSDYYDQSDMIPSGGGYASIGVSNNIKPHKASALEVTEDGWHKYMIGSVTKDLATKSGFCFQICKFHDKRQEGASIDDLYIDRVELVERTPDFENLKFTEVFYNEITNSNFEEKVTEDNWGPLTDGLTVEKVTDKQYDWQGNYQLVFDAEKSNGQEYVRAIPIAKQKKNYTFAAWTKLSEGSDISVGFYKNGKYQKFENIVNGEKGTLKLIDDGKWNRVSFTFNVGDSTEGYLVIKGTKGILELDMVELFVAEKGYLTDPNISAKPPKFEMFDPIAFPDKVITDVTYIENDVEEPEEEEIVEEEQEEEKKPSKKKKYKVLVKKPGGISPWVWVGVGAGVLVIAAGVVFLILFKKRNKTKKEAE